MKYNLYPHTINSKPGMPYGKLTDMGGNCVEINVLSNVLDFIVSKDHTIANGDEVVKWIYNNCMIVSK